MHGKYIYSLLLLVRREKYSSVKHLVKHSSAQLD